MDYNDIQPQTLQRILLKPQNARQNLTIFTQVIDWNSNLEPSLAITKKKISNFLLQQKNQQRIIISAKAAVQVIETMHQGKCPRNFIRAYMAVLKQNMQNIEGFIDQKYVRERWMHIPLDILEPYMQAFNLKQIISLEQYDEKFNSLIENKMYQACFQLIKIGQLKQKHTSALINRMTTNKQASKAADYIKQLNLNPKDFPGVGQRLYKTTARHFLGNHGWQYAQEIFQEHPQALASVVEDMVYKKKFKEAISVLERNQVMKFIHKPETLQIIQKIQKKQQYKNFQRIPNYLHKNHFGPSNSQKYLTLKELGINQQDIIWIDSNSKNLKQIMLQISQAEVLGVDTESIVGQTKFQKKKQDSATLIQIATHKKIYLIDGLNSNHPLITETIKKVMQGQNLIVGHSLNNDLDTLFRAVNLKQKIKLNNIVDIWKIFKKIFPNKKYSSLAYICKQILGKQICKQQTLTNWKRRPLRRNQIHYAAMDAYVVIKVYDKLMEGYGQVIRYYLQMDDQQI